jgi:hypothetical protein
MPLLWTLASLVLEEIHVGFVGEGRDEQNEETARSLASLSNYIFTIVFARVRLTNRRNLRKGTGC